MQTDSQHLSDRPLVRVPIPRTVTVKGENVAYREVSLSYFIVFEAIALVVIIVLYLKILLNVEYSHN